MLTLEPCRLTLKLWRLTLCVQSHPGALEALTGAVKAHQETQKLTLSFGDHPGAVEADPEAIVAHPGVVVSWSNIEPLRITLEKI
jgi:hypothetical protein